MSLLGAYALWYAGLRIDRCALPYREIIGFAYILLSAWCLAPKMASWEAVGVRSIRRLAAAGAFVVLVTASLAQLLLFKMVTSLPDALVPGGSSYTLEGYGREIWYPVVANLLVIGGLAMLSVALLGRPVGSLVAGAAYGTLLYLSTMTSASVPYASYCGADRGEPPWIAGGVASAAATIIWLRTGGATALAQRLDYKRR